MGNPILASEMLLEMIPDTFLWELTSASGGKLRYYR
jgi:hypothetical protein